MNLIKKRLLKIASVEEVKSYMESNGYNLDGKHYKQDFVCNVYTPYVTEVNDALKTNNVKFTLNVDMQAAEDANAEIDDTGKSVIVHITHFIDMRVNKIYRKMIEETTFNTLKDAVEYVKSMIKNNIDINYAKDDIIKCMKDRKMLKEETIDNCSNDNFFAHV